jgi:hypothetical protein
MFFPILHFLQVSVKKSIAGTGILDTVTPFDRLRADEEVGTW